MSNPIVTCHLGLRFRLALEFGLKFSDYEALFMGNMSFSLSGGFRNLEEIYIVFENPFFNTHTPA